MITEFLRKWRQRRREKMVFNLLVARAGLVGQLEGCRLAGLAAPHIRRALAETNEELRLLGHKVAP